MLKHLSTYLISNLTDLYEPEIVLIYLNTESLAGYDLHGSHQDQVSFFQFNRLLLLFD